MAHKDKTFYVGPGMDRRSAISFGLQEQLPQELSVGKRSGDVTIDVWEDITTKAQDGELWRCELRIMLEGMLHHDEVKVFWNEQEVPEENIRKAERVFQMRETSRARGYRLHIDLRQVSLPLMGTNKLRVDLIKKDEKLITPIEVSDVDIAVESLPGRNQLRDAETYEGASIPFTP